MVTALSRKELNQTIIEQLKPYRYWIKDNTEKSKSYQDNFPYALQEFMNSHVELPTLDELIGKRNQSVLSISTAR